MTRDDFGNHPPIEMNMTSSVTTESETTESLKPFENFEPVEIEPEIRLQGSQIHGWKHPVLLSHEQLLSECQARRQQTSGPGGQHRNKVETGVFLKHSPTGVEAQATERRSQAENQSKALKRLRLQLALEVRSQQSAIEAPSALWKSRVREQKIVVSDEHFDFPILLSEALDVLAEHAWEPHRAALQLDCSTSQLIKLLKKFPPAFVLLNQQRARRGLEKWR